MILCGFLLISVAIAWVKGLCLCFGCDGSTPSGPKWCAICGGSGTRDAEIRPFWRLRALLDWEVASEMGPLATGERPFESCKSSTAKLPVPTTRKNLGFGGKKSGWWRTKPDYGMAHPTTATTCTHGHTEMESNHRRNGISQLSGHVRHSEGTCYNAKNRGQRK